MRPVWSVQTWECFEFLMLSRLDVTSLTLCHLWSFSLSVWVFYPEYLFTGVSQYAVHPFFLSFVPHLSWHLPPIQCHELRHEPFMASHNTPRCGKGCSTFYLRCRKVFIAFFHTFCKILGNQKEKNLVYKGRNFISLYTKKAEDTHMHAHIGDHMQTYCKLLFCMKLFTPFIILEVKENRKRKYPSHVSSLFAIWC